MTNKHFEGIFGDAKPFEENCPTNIQIYTYIYTYNYVDLYRFYFDKTVKMTLKAFVFVLIQGNIGKQFRIEYKILLFYY